MHIQKMTERDISAAAALDFANTPHPWTPGMFLEELHLNAFCRVLWNGSLQGFVIARLQFDEWHLLNLTVATAQRRQGWGKRLVRTVIQRAIQNHSRGLLLEVRRSNSSAQRLYQTLGFREISVRKGYYRHPLQIEDGVIMRHALEVT